MIEELDSKNPAECPTSGNASLDQSNRGEADFQFHLAKDILQGEDAPFFVLWKRPGMSRIKLEYEGFDSIASLHNISSGNKVFETCTVSPEDLKSYGYFGGVLKTRVTDEPFREAYLEVLVEFEKGEPVKLREKRTLYTSRATVARLPETIQLDDNTRSDAPVLIDIKGCSTVFIETDETKGTEIHLMMPPEVSSAFERFLGSVMEGLELLKEKFPERAPVIQRMLKGPEDSNKSSIGQYLDSVISELESTFRHDKEFKDAYATVLLTAFVDQSSVKETIFLPLMEYLESNAASKVFLRSPFLVLDIPSGGGAFSCKVSTFNLLDKQCGSPVTVATRFESKNAKRVLLKEIFGFRRV